MPLPNTIPMGPMANPALLTDPNYVAQSMQLQRQQALAQALSQQGMSNIDYDPRGRISPLQGINKMLAAYLGGTMGNNAINGQANLTAQGMGAMLQQAGSTAAQLNGGGQSTQPPAPSPATQALGMGAAGGSVGPTTQNAATMNSLPPQAAPAPQGAAGVQVTPMDIVMARMGDPVSMEKVKTALANSALSPEQKLANDPRFGINYINKQLSIPIRPGGGVMGKNGAITMMPGAAPEGFQNVQLADGSWGMVPVRGGTSAITQSTAAKQGGMPMQIFNPATRAMATGWTSDILGAPGSGAAPQPIQPPGTQQTPASGNPNQPSPSRAAMAVSNPAQLQAIKDSLPELQQDIARAQQTGDQGAVAAAQRQLADAQARLQAGTPWATPPAARTVQTGPALGQGATADTLGTDSAKNAVDNYNELHTAATTSAPRAIGLLQSIEQLADKTLVGPGANKVQFVNGALNMLGITPTSDSAQNYQLLMKNTAMLIAAQRQAAPGGGTDAYQNLSEAMNPNGDKMNAPAIKEASQELIAYNRMIMAKDKVAPNPMTVGPQAYADFETKFAPFNDPRLWQIEHAQNDQERLRIMSLMPLQQRGQFLNLAKQARANGILN